jgi:hypothetical protein
MSKLYCSPDKYNINAKNCLPKDVLKRMITDINKFHKKDLLKIHGNTDENKIWTIIRDHFQNLCGENEWCWIDQKEFTELIDNDYISKYYKPKTNDNAQNLLDTVTLNNTMKQYENAIPDFAFLGTVPIDFKNIINSIEMLDFCKMYNKGIRCVGIIFNLDKHNEGGSHWVCSFLDIRKKNKEYIGYFDSYGYCPPPKEITEYMNTMKENIKKCINIDVKKKCNTTRHQLKYTECGVYCLYFIYHCLMGDDFDTLSSNIIRDDEVSKYRNILFRPKTK